MKNQCLLGCFLLSASGYAMDQNQLVSCQSSNSNHPNIYVTVVNQMPIANNCNTNNSTNSQFVQVAPSSIQNNLSPKVTSIQFPEEIKQEYQKMVETEKNLKIAQFLKERYWGSRLTRILDHDKIKLKMMYQDLMENQPAIARFLLNSPYENIEKAFAKTYFSKTSNADKIRGTYKELIEEKPSVAELLLESNYLEEAFVKMYFSENSASNTKQRKLDLWNKMISCGYMNDPEDPDPLVKWVWTAMKSFSPDDLGLAWKRMFLTAHRDRCNIEKGSFPDTPDNRKQKIELEELQVLILWLLLK